MTFYSILSFCRANGKSFVCDVNGFSFVKNSNKYYDDTSQILGNMILRNLAPKMDIPWSVPFQLDDPPIVSFLIKVVAIFRFLNIFLYLRSQRPLAK